MFRVLPRVSLARQANIGLAKDAVLFRLLLVRPVFIITEPAVQSAAKINTLWQAPISALDVPKNSTALLVAHLAGFAGLASAGPVLIASIVWLISIR